MKNTVLKVMNNICQGEILRVAKMYLRAGKPRPEAGRSRPPALAQVAHGWLVPVENGSEVQVVELELGTSTGFCEEEVQLLG